TMIIGGVLGPVKAYLGTVESQGRGSLHLYLLIWLDINIKPTPSASDHSPQLATDSIYTALRTMEFTNSERNADHSNPSTVWSTPVKGQSSPSIPYASPVMLGGSPSTSYRSLSIP
ncbi:unnamed protein product, partial [Adineta ricciae]